ncbi:MAG: metallophosphoesterase [Chloroflexi bacterium]|nr:metallophosphoesterase [Chloroflexota bacterium]
MSSPEASLERSANAAVTGGFNFIQLADPQFGMFAEISARSPERIAEWRAAGRIVREVPLMTGFAPETGLFTEAILVANQRHPAFVVVCGDIVYDWDDDPQAEEARRIAGQLDEGIDLHWVAGNHDVGVDSGHRTPTRESLARYRAGFGPDNYAFQQGDTSFIVLNSSVMQAPEEVPDEWKSQLDFLAAELDEAKRRGSAHTVLFTHIPLFLSDPDEDGPESNSAAIPLVQRRPVLDLLRRYGADAVFAGHLHENNYAADGKMEMVASGPVGYPVGVDGSGFREVRVTPDRIDHRWSHLAYKPPYKESAAD